LWEGQTDEDEMGFTYEVLDSVILNDAANNDFIENIRKKNKNSEHKRKMPLIYESNWRKF
ncbi:MAG: hypothetical protein QMB54_05115, partial [Neofamilia sp.]